MIIARQGQDNMQTIVPIFGPSSFRILALGAALALAGCETAGLGGAPSGNVAEVEVDTSGASSVNIASLSDVIQRNPND